MSIEMLDDCPLMETSLTYPIRRLLSENRHLIVSQMATSFDFSEPEYSPRVESQ